jgi:hypothetical protein
MTRNKIKGKPVTTVDYTSEGNIITNRYNNVTTRKGLGGRTITKSYIGKTVNDNVSKKYYGMAVKTRSVTSKRGTKTRTKVYKNPFRID